MRNRFLLTICTALLTLPVSGWSGVPQLVHYQGILTDTGGDPVTSPVNVVFALWNQPTLGDSLWSESQPVTPDTLGRFNVLLGSWRPIHDSVFAGSDVYLSVKAGGDPEMIPRQRIVSVPFAYRVSTVDSAGGGTITSKVSIGPGHTNTGEDAFVVGRDNTASGNYSSIGGGRFNKAIWEGASVGGGYDNIASNIYATVAGGAFDSAGNAGATVAGGCSNTASGVYSSVGGGQFNTAEGSYTTVGGGRYHEVAAAYSTIVGGNADTIAAGADYSYLFGMDSRLTQDSTFMVDMPHIRFGDEASGYEFPAADGTAGQTLVTDGDGQLNWANAAGLPLVETGNLLVETKASPPSPLAEDGQATIIFAQDFALPPAVFVTAVVQDNWIEGLESRTPGDVASAEVISYADSCVVTVRAVVGGTLMTGTQVELQYMAIGAAAN